MSDFRKCPHCGKDSARDAKGRPMKLCGSVDCKRLAANERNRQARARKRAAAEPAPGPERAPEPLGVIEAPWGMTFESEAEAWGHVLLSNGLPLDERVRRSEWLCEATEYNPVA